MAEWNFDMTKAPRGKVRLVAAGQGKGTRKVPERVDIIAASACGVVTVTRWLDDQKRWNMFTSEVGPIAWMPYAGPRQYMDDKGRNRYTVDLPPHPSMATSWFADLLAERRAA